MTVWTFSLELEPFVLLILPEAVQFVSAMEFLPSMTSASELFAVSSAFWTVMAAAAVIFGAMTGRMAQVGAAALEGARSAVELCLSMAGVVCLWTGVMEVMERCGLAGGLARLLRPALRRILPQASRDGETLAAVSANVSANLLGLGNAATPLGIRAARRMAAGCDGVASDELCRLVVLNTASIQLLPTTVAGVRLASGAAAPFDILPAVWLSSVLSVAAGLLMARVLGQIWGRG